MKIKKLTLENVDKGNIVYENYIAYNRRPPDFWKRKSYIYISENVFREDDFWDFILEFCVIIKVEYDLTLNGYKIFIMSSILPPVEEGEPIPEYETTIKEYD